MKLMADYLTREKEMIDVPLKKGTDTQKLAQWCTKNISKQEYHISSDSQHKAGGVGWEISRGKNGCILSIKDKKMLTFLLLSINVI